MTQQNLIPSDDLINILLIVRNPQIVSNFFNALDQSNYRIVHVSESGISLLKEVENIQPDVILIDIESPDRDMLESLHNISKSAPKPVVMISENDNTKTINKLVQYGVSAYVVGGVNQVRLKSVLDIAIARFTEYQGLKNELAATKQKLTTQITVDKAKSWLMEAKNMTEIQAYHSIRKIAMDNSQKMDDVAKNILSVAAMLESNS
jgi:response regulator NasT